MEKKFGYISLIAVLFLVISNITLAVIDTTSTNSRSKTNHGNKNTNIYNKTATSEATDTTTPNSTLIPNSRIVDPEDDEKVASAEATDTTTPNSTLTPNSSIVDPEDDEKVADASDKTTPTKSTEEVVNQDKLPVTEKPKTVASSEDVITKTNETITDIDVPSGDEIKASKTTTETTTPNGETTTTTETTVTTDETTKTNKTAETPKPADNPINCGIENCHGLEIVCSEKEPPMCTLEYMLGDKCRQYAKCAVIDGKCQVLPSDDFDACKTCVEKCKLEFPEDTTQAILCEADCV